MADADFGYVTPGNLAAFVDRYEVAMVEAYLDADHEPEATFDLFVRDLPADRGYLIAAGLEQVVHYLDGLEFDDPTIAFLRERGFGEEVLGYLESFEFTGDVRALPEGTAAFPDEPLIEVTAPVTEAQLFETLVINQVGFQTMIATKAARMRDAVDRYGDGQSLVDFGSRRAHGVDAGVKAARAAYLAGFDGTSNLVAGELFDLPTYGTMAHSWVQSFPSERAAFEAFVDVYGEESILLVDTYDTLRGTELATAVAEERGVDLAGVRIDSGDLASVSKAVADVIAAADSDAGVFVSSGLDEYRIREFLERDGVAVAFGPGTALATSVDAPALDAVYKLVAVERDGETRPSMKLSPGKATYPGAKTVRRVERGGEFVRDVLGVRADADDPDVEGEEQLVSVFENGDLVYDLPDLDEIRARTARTLDAIPDAARRFESPTAYEVRVSDRLRARTEDLERDLGAARGDG